MKTTKIIAAGILACMSSIAVAGLLIVTPVDVTLNGDGSGGATGNMAAARLSDNDVEYMGCGTRNVDTGGGVLFQFAFCQAGDAAEEEIFCSTQNTELVAAVRAVADYSFVIFNVNTLGECTSIGFSTQSFYIPGKKAH